MADLPPSSYLTDLSPKDKPWDKHRGFVETVRGIYQLANHDKYANRMGFCSNLLEFGLVSTESDGQQFKLKAAKFCRVRHCSVCQWRRSLKWRARFFQAMPEITNKYPTHRWIFLTLTVKNCDLVDLRSTTTEMTKAFVRLSKLKIFPGAGWIKSLEVTRNPKTGQAHPHFHVLMLVPSGYFGGKSYIKADKWAELWQQSLRSDYLPIVNIKAVKGKTANADGMAAAVCETLKYSVKEEDLIVDADWLIGITKQLHKTRAVSIGGCLREFLKEEKEDDDLINIEDSEDAKLPESDISVYFGWRETIKRYKLNNA
jgi:plasmid rolling circle replication initiator protein Rep